MALCLTWDHIHLYPVITIVTTKTTLTGTNANRQPTKSWKS
jgi:hypothetical protein